MNTPLLLYTSALTSRTGAVYSNGTGHCKFSTTKKNIWRKATKECNGVEFLFDLDESECGRKLKHKETKSSWFEGLGVWGPCWMLFKPQWPQSQEPVCCLFSRCGSIAISMCWLISQKYKFDLAQEQAHDHISVKLARTHHTELSWSLCWLYTSWGRMNDFQYSLS